MTPFRNDDGNPFSRPSLWPKMPQAPMSLGALPRARPPAPAPTPRSEPERRVEDISAAPVGPSQVVEAEIVIAAPSPAERAAEVERAIPQAPPAAERSPEPEVQTEPRPIAAPILRRAAAPRPPLRLTPLIAAAAVGAGGMAALFLVLGVRPALAPAAAPAPARAALAVGEMVGGSAASRPAPVAAAELAATPVAASPPPRLAMVRSIPRRAALAAPAPASAAPAIQVPAATADLSTVLLQAPAQPPAASSAATVEPPAAPASPPYKPPPPPDRNAPIVTHAPDGN